MSSIPSSDRQRFLQETYYANFYRARFFAAALLILIVIVTLATAGSVTGPSSVFTAARGFLFYLNVAAGLLTAALVLAMFLYKPGAPKSVRFRHAAVVPASVSVALLWSAAFSSTVHQSPAAIVIYLAALVVSASAFFIGSAIELAMLAAAHAVFLIGVWKTVGDANLRFADYVSGSAMVLISWAVSRIIFSSRVREFLGTRTIERQKAEIQQTKERTEEILRNVLPEAIVRQIGGPGYPPPKYNASTTIVFADFVSFYKIAETSDALNVLKILEKMFDSFDSCVRNHGLEKLKTIGDGYMYAGGLFTEHNQLEDSVEAAVEMMGIVRESSEFLRMRTGHEWALRIGMHTGPVITGIIGTWRFTYDVWGTTVNIASRLEAASSPNKINVSQQIYDSLRSKGRYFLEPRGALAIKNMHPVEMYFLERLDGQGVSERFA